MNERLYFAVCHLDGGVVEDEGVKSKMLYAQP